LSSTKHSLHNSLAVVKELGIDRKKLNGEWCAIAVGHPLGSSGADCLLQLFNETEKTKEEIEW